MVLPQLSIDGIRMHFAMQEYNELPHKEYNLHYKFFAHIFQCNLPFPTVHKVKVVLNQWAKTNHIKVYTRNFKQEIMPQSGGSAEKYVCIATLLDLKVLNDRIHKHQGMAPIVYVSGFSKITLDEQNCIAGVLWRMLLLMHWNSHLYLQGV